MQNCEKFYGLLVGCHYKKGRRGVEWPIDRLEWGGSKGIVSRAKNLGVKKLYCYIYNPINPNSISFNERDDYWRLPSLLMNNSGKIYGEGLIKDFDDKRNEIWDYIILQEFEEYQNYIPIEKASNLHHRIAILNKKYKTNQTVKQRIRLGLPITKTECKQITKLSFSNTHTL